MLLQKQRLASDKIQGQNAGMKIGEGFASRCPRGKLREQDVQTFLREVMIVGEHVRKPLVAHRLHGDAIRQAIMLIKTALI